MASPVVVAALFLGVDLTTAAGRAFTERVLDFMRDRLQEYQEETGQLFNLEATPAEATNVADRHPDVVARLQALADRCREDLGDTATKQPGKGVRAPGKLAVRG